MLAWNWDAARLRGAKWSLLAVTSTSHVQGRDDRNLLLNDSNEEVVSGRARVQERRFYVAEL